MPPQTCFHGGAFFEAIGAEFDDVNRRHSVVNADVLDAWFDPSPGVKQALMQQTAWMARTSPPTYAEGLRRVISRTRGIHEDQLVLGAGSSSLIFLAFRHWLTRQSRVLIPEITYGEYAHVLENVIGCRVDRIPCDPGRGFGWDPDILRSIQPGQYDLIAFVNPGNPTGLHIPRSVLQPLLQQVPEATRIWVDEAYVDYVDAAESLETTVSQYANLFICKSLSKVYALSGMRAAYLCAPPIVAAELRHLTPPWAIGLAAQMAAVAALLDPKYYVACYERTHALRRELAATLRSHHWDVIEGQTNSLMIRCADRSATDLVQYGRQRNIFLREFPQLPLLAREWVRVAVKDVPDNRRIAECLNQWKTILRGVPS